MAIVLSGGGTLLYTHIGVLQALEDAGLLNDHTFPVRARASRQIRSGALAGSHELPQGTVAV